LTRVLFAGDWHADAEHACRVVDLAAELGIRRVVQVGDFGFWPRFDRGRDFLTRVAARCVERGVGVWFCDGNHEDHDRLPHATAQGPVEVAPSIRWVPRGHVVEWGGRRILFFGGAASVDRYRRSAGVDWFEAEMPGEAAWSRAEAAGRVDVVVAHEGLPDTPLVSTYRGTIPPEILTASATMRARLGRLAERIEPAVWVHGHWHHRMTAQRGATRVECLAESRAAPEDTVLAYDLDGPATS
jgi:Calcineurin-like phosphoesterase